MKKLVRDNIPKIIKSSGGTCVTHNAQDQEYIDALKAKLSEEVKEYLESNDEEELADILEVIHALAKHHQMTPIELEQLRLDKHLQRGGFSQRIILDKVESSEAD